MSQEEKVLMIARSMAESIRDLTVSSPLRGVPSGHLYASVMHVLSLEQYQAIILVLKGAGLVHEEGYLLSYVGAS